MAYPNFDNKHLEESLFGPQDRPSFKKVPKNLPKKYILIYDRNLKARIKRKLSPKKISKLSRTLMDFYCYKDVGIIFMKGVGSPHAVMALEQLIAYGGKIFLNIGSAGGLKEEGFFLCKKALRDEGTSYHYISQGEYSYPNNFLKKKGSIIMTVLAGQLMHLIWKQKQKLKSILKKVLLLLKWKHLRFLQLLQ